MGQAKNRGTFEQRVAQATERYEHERTIAMRMSIEKKMAGNVKESRSTELGIDEKAPKVLDVRRPRVCVIDDSPFRSALIKAALMSALGPQL